VGTFLVGIQSFTQRKYSHPIWREEIFRLLRCLGEANNPRGYEDDFRMDTADVVWAVILLVVVPLLGIAAAPWLMYPITKLVAVASYLYLLPL
jgi:hypothetical protein